MFFESFSELIAMDGHGGYVWFCYGVASCVITSLIVQPLQSKRRFLKQQAAILKRQQATRG